MEGVHVMQEMHFIGKYATSVFILDIDAAFKFQSVLCVILVAQESLEDTKCYPEYIWRGNAWVLGRN